MGEHNFVPKRPNLIIKQKPFRMENEQFVIGAIMAKDPDTLSQDEQNILNGWLSNNNNQEIFDKATSEENKRQGIIRLYELSQENDRCRQKLYTTVGIIPMDVPEKRTIKIWRSWPRYIVAASVVLVVSVGVYLWYENKQDSRVVEPSAPQQGPIENDAAPGQFKAKLVLANGSSIVLDSAVTGKLAQQGNVTVVNEDGKLLYRQSDQQNNQQTEVLYNKLVTSKGETFVTVLADGSKVWLNSESSISYPVTFTGDERKVTITGEAYFEVATAFVQKGNTSVKQPFKVVADNMEVEVLGTHFNVNAYPDEEAIKTTLLEGKVKIVSGGTSALLAPGQQAKLKRQAKLLQVMDDADIEQAVAWKNGFFQFNDDDLKAVMRQLARWYDVDVVYQGNVNGDDTYGGRINRNSKASEVLTILGRNRVHYKIEGKRIIITP